MASTRSSCKDLLERISPGSPQDLLLRSCARSCKDILERNLAGSPLPREFTMNRPQTKSPRRRLCGSLRSRNAHGHLTRAILCDNLQEKCRAPRSGQPRGADFVQACAVEMQIPQCGHCLGKFTLFHTQDTQLTLDFSFFPFETFNHWVR